MPKMECAPSNDAVALMFSSLDVMKSALRLSSPSFSGFVADSKSPSFLGFDPNVVEHNCAEHLKNLQELLLKFEREVKGLGLSVESSDAQNMSAVEQDMLPRES